MIVNQGWNFIDIPPPAFITQDIRLWIYFRKFYEGIIANGNESFVYPALSVRKFLSLFSFRISKRVELLKVNIIESGAFLQNPYGRIIHLLIMLHKAARQTPGAIPPFKQEYLELVFVKAEYHTIH